MNLVSFQGKFTPKFIARDQQELRALEDAFAKISQYVQPVKDTVVFVLPHLVIPESTMRYRIRSSSDKPQPGMVLESGDGYLGICIDDYAFHIYDEWRPDLITKEI